MDKQDIQHWNGEGLPPVGIEVEFKNNGYCCSGHIPDDFQAVSVVTHKTTTDGNPVAVVYWDDHGAGRANAFIAELFRPIRTPEQIEAERRERVVNELVYQFIVFHADPKGAERYKKEAEAIYDAIRAGLIEGVKIDG
ncbi:hypothetical protein HZI30_05555 [Serratia fonticola]|uniref:hypothetical protein n=1 Tax=Serratia fonticola TaxID=47917 RepID=UPI0015C5DDEF|nr:hypothetical protein [Serratia fonticola]NXZ86402.1 hypothetical protein [Serratia fonticola]